MDNSRSSAIALCNPKSPSNVGVVMRAAGCYGASAIYYTGNRFARAAKYHQDTQNVSQHIELSAIESFAELVGQERKLVCVELVVGATPLPEFIHPDQALYVFGPEDGSIDQSLIDMADEVVYIPTVGCMNLAATVNVVLYDRMAKQQQSIDHNERVKSSRDVNNRLVFRHHHPCPSDH
ncbi:RNA methyltransferase [Oceanobacter sp. 5_MG-2023]|uniref:RNA methyltransferase n=1 Tax=Oceanobacter sp. 5_MG-2023 TaxID=3062645 RepID=UPI0026E1C562|nr:RNA methyltransferase [Oceanobacter sp. 5_MG-2023]MDO6683023.1 RNA methyltransferase [Oceanobacter sp. 5_MG-2023]